MLTSLRELIKRPLIKIRNLICSIRNKGTGRICPVCMSEYKNFCTYGTDRRFDALCPNCNALERHRLEWLFFQRKTNLFNGTEKKVLHIAPEVCFVKRLKHSLGAGYITADLLDPFAMVKMDITNIKYPDEYFDVILCSHVLEHVTEDRKAMKEFFRVLKKVGWALLLVPITAEKTFEDPTITDPKERLKVFGQEDHVRRYGPDYLDRLNEAGFKVEIFTAQDIAQESEITTFGLTRASGELFYCTK